MYDSLSWRNLVICRWQSSSRQAISTLFGKLDNRESQEQVSETFKPEIESHTSGFVGGGFPGSHVIIYSSRSVANENAVSLLLG